MKSKTISRESSSKRIAYCNQVLAVIKELDFVKMSYRYVDARTKNYRVKLEDYTCGFNDTRFEECKQVLEKIFAEHNFEGLKIKRSQKGWVNKDYADDSLCITIPFTPGWDDVK